MKKLILSALTFAMFSFFINCKNCKKPNEQSEISKNMENKIKELITVKLTTDLTKLTSKEKQMLPILIEISKIMDDIFWVETLGDKEKFFNGISDSLTKKFAEINYGPWERLDGDKPFVSSFGKKPLGANFYPTDMTKEEFEKLKDKNKTSQYTLLKRNDDKSLKVVWYHEAFKEKIEKAASLLKEATKLAEDEGFKKYLNMRAEALLTDNYQPSDMAWLDMKNNMIDFVVGPIETYEDGIFGYKASHEAMILIKDKDWSKKLDKYIATLPELQKQLPVDEKYKAEKPGTNSDLNAYDVIYYAGNANSGGKTIAINLPNDEQVQLKKGSRRLQLKNTMKAKFDNILVPISGVLIDESQKKYIKFDAFFNNVMFHEVAHGIGIKQTINGKGSVREAMQNTASAFEEGKADILGLFIVTKLIEKGIVTDCTTEENYVTFMAGLIRSVRFGASDAHGKANMMCFNYFENMGAFKRSGNGTYKVDFEKMKLAMNSWSKEILEIQGNGYKEKALKYLNESGIIKPELQKDIERLKNANIPKDIVFEQGKEVLGL
ncbi:MAG: Zn-dependent hydrolase [Bacteroidales bacterium]|jgi:hypothetical protein